MNHDSDNSRSVAFSDRFLYAGRYRHPGGHGDGLAGRLDDLDPDGADLAYYYGNRYRDTHHDLMRAVHRHALLRRLRTGLARRALRLRGAGRTAARRDLGCATPTPLMLAPNLLLFAVGFVGLYAYGRGQA